MKGYCLVLCVLGNLVAWGAAPDWKALQRAANAGKVRNVEWSLDSQNLFFRMATGNVLRCYSLTGNTFEKKAKPADAFKQTKNDVNRRRWRNPNRIPAPDGSRYAVHSNNNVYIECKGTLTQLTEDGTPWMRYGAVSWLYNEDKGQFDGMWWSPDSCKLAYYKFDERNVPHYPMVYNTTGPCSRIEYRGYPNPGDPIPIISLYIYDTKSKKTVKVDCGPSTNQYVYHIKYSPDSSTLFFNRLDRRQRILELVKVNPETGGSKVGVTNSRPTWVYNEAFVDFIKDGKQFIWANYDNDYVNFEIRDLDGKQIVKVIDGLYEVREILRIDETNNWIFYVAYSNKELLNAQLHKVRLDGTGHQQLTKDELHYSEFSISPDGQYFVAQNETVKRPADTWLYNSNGEAVVQLGQGDLAPFANVPLAEIFRFKADDGETDLFGILYKPWGFNPSNRYALVNNIYCGTGSKDVCNVFQYTHQATQHGYLLTKIDGRGTLGRGYPFIEAVYGKVGIVELKDNADGMRVLMKRPYIDPERIGVYGTSHGGFMTGRAMLGYPGIYKVGVANAGVHDWRYYTATYAERFMGLSSENKEGYEQSSNILNAKNLQGKFLIQQGMIDINVHVNNALALADALHKAGKDFELQIYPNNGHYIGRDGYERQWAFLKKHLLDPYDEKGNRK